MLDISVKHAYDDLAMTKAEAIDIFGSQVALAKAMGVTSQAVSQWPEELSLGYSDRVIGAAWRLGRLPEAMMREASLAAGLLTPNSLVWVGSPFLNPSSKGRRAICLSADSDLST